MDGYMDVSPDGFAGRIEVVEGPSGRRRWSDEEKARIASERYRPGVHVADVVRRYGAKRWQICDWRLRLTKGLLALAADVGPIVFEQNVLWRTWSSGLNNAEVFDLSSETRGFCRHGLQDFIGFSPEPCNFGSPHEAPLPSSRAERSLPTAPRRHDRPAPRAGRVGGADRLGVLRARMGRVLPVHDGSAGDVAAAGGFFICSTRSGCQTRLWSRAGSRTRTSSTSPARPSFNTARRLTRHR